MSAAFLSSKYIRGVEMDTALKRRTAREAELVALILEADREWRGREFTRYQVMPPDVKSRP